jgi:hypothetical protein
MDEIKEISIWSDKYDRRLRRHTPDKCLFKVAVKPKRKRGWLEIDIPEGLPMPDGRSWLVVNAEGVLYTCGDSADGKGFFQNKKRTIITSLAIAQTRKDGTFMLQGGGLGNLGVSRGLKMVGGS